MAKQGQLPGVGPKQIEEIEDKAEEVRTLCADRKAIAAKEETARGELKELFKKHGVKKVYQYVIEDDGKEITIDALLERPEAKAYVRKHKNPKAKDDDSDGKSETDVDDEKD
jgi:hypothetical protein